MNEELTEEFKIIASKLCDDIILAAKKADEENMDREYITNALIINSFQC